MLNNLDPTIAQALAPFVQPPVKGDASLNKLYYAPKASGWDKPEAIRLAGWLDKGVCDAPLVAAELRRLNEVNAALLEALCKLAQLYDAMNAPRGPRRIMADAAIAKALGGN